MLLEVIDKEETMVSNSLLIKNDLPNPIKEISTYVSTEIEGLHAKTSHSGFYEGFATYC